MHAPLIYLHHKFKHIIIVCDGLLRKYKDIHPLDKTLARLLALGNKRIYTPKEVVALALHFDPINPLIKGTSRCIGEIKHYIGKHEKLKF